MSFPSHSKISLMTTNASQPLAAAWLIRAVAYTSFSDVQRSFTPFGSESKSSGPHEPPTFYPFITQNLVPKKSHVYVLHAEPASAWSQPASLLCSFLVLRLSPWKTFCALAPWAPCQEAEQTMFQAGLSFCQLLLLFQSGYRLGSLPPL